MDFRVLGPLEVWDGDREIVVSRRQQRALLALLVLRYGETVSADRLIDELWGGDPPSTALGSLQNAISQLRGALGHSAVLTQPAGYLLAIDRSEVDSARFERLVEESRTQADSTARTELLREALTLWRGSAFAGIVDVAPVVLEAARLEEMRVSAREDLLEAELALGRHGAVAGEAEALVAQHPFRERLRRLWILALYRSGRQNDALAAYRQTRQLLLDELGLEPGDELKQLERAILSHDPALDAPAASADPVAPAPPAIRPPPLQRKTVTVLFVDVEASSERGEPLDPEMVQALTARWVAATTDVIERHAGAPETSAGGEVMAVFGVPASHEDDALRAIRAALGIRDAVGALNAELARESSIHVVARFGLDTGVVVVSEGATGASAVRGEVVVSAKRLQQSSRPGEIVAGANVRSSARGGVEFDLVAESPLAYRVVRMLEAAVAAAGRPQAPLVGRAAELAHLNEELGLAAAGLSCRVTGVVGDAGVGKSRLVAEFTAAAQGVAAVVVGRCISYGEGATYLPVIEILRSALGADPSERLASLLAEDPDRELVISRIGALLGRDEGRSQSGELFWAVRRVFETLAATTPLVVVVDDCHWAEPTLLDLIEYLAEWSAGAPILLVWTARLELLDERPAWTATALRLDPLTDEAAGTVLDRLAEGNVSPHVRGQIIATAEGNPLFLEQLLAFAQEGGDPTSVPPTLDMLLASRLDRLPPDEHELLQRAAVVGREFWRTAVLHLTPRDGEATLDRGLMSLVRRGLVRSASSRLAGDDAYRFHHVLVRDAAYASITKETRVELHRRCADWLEQGAEADDALVGYHLERAYRYRCELSSPDEEAAELADRAAHLLSAAGERALSQGDNTAAVNLLGRADFLGLDGREGALLLYGLGDALRRSGDIPGSIRVLDEAAERATGAGDPATAASSRMFAALVRTEGGGSVAEALATAEEVIAELEELGDDRALGRAWLATSGSVHQVRMHHTLGCEASARAVAYAERAGDRETALDAMRNIGVQMFYGADPVEAIAAHWEAFTTRVEGNSYRAESALRHLACVRAYEGRFDEARALAASSREILERLGQAYMLAQSAAGTHARIERLAGNLAAAEAELRYSVERMDAFGSVAHQTMYGAILAGVLVAKGQLDEADELTRTAEALSAEDDVSNQIEWRRVRAVIIARRGDVAAAEPLAREALSIALTTDSLITQADAYASLADVLEAAERDDEARGALEEALALYERKGNVPDAARMRQRLDSYAVASDVPPG